MSARSVPGVHASARCLAGHFEGGKIDKGLGGAARLARRQGHVDLTVDLHIVEVGAAHQGDNLAILRFHGHQRAVGDVAIGQERNLLAHDAFGLGLQCGIQSRMDAVAGLVEPLRAKHLLQLLAH